MLFDTDKYIENKLQSHDLTRGMGPMKPPNNKVEATNLAKLALDKKTVLIQVRKQD
jgi:hypothetical protein